MPLIKDGVVFKNLKPRALRVFGVFDKVYAYFGVTCTITSANDSTHMAGSKHYTDDAWDLRTWTLEPDQIYQCATLLRYELGHDYDVVVEKDHIHVEYDPKVQK